MANKSRLKHFFRRHRFVYSIEGVGVDRILESDACSQNKFSGAEKMSDTSIRPTTSRLSEQQT